MLMKSFFVVSIHLLRQNKNALEDVASSKAWAGTQLLHLSEVLGNRFYLYRGFM